MLICTLSMSKALPININQRSSSPVLLVSLQYWGRVWGCVSWMLMKGTDMPCTCYRVFFSPCFGLRKMPVTSTDTLNIQDVSAAKNLTWSAQVQQDSRSFRWKSTTQDSFWLMFLPLHLKRWWVCVCRNPQSRLPQDQYLFLNCCLSI